MKQQILSVEAGATIKADGAVWEVKPACAEKNKGHWFCATHGRHFANQLEKDGHIHTGKHELVWVCHAHGFEQP